MQGPPIINFLFTREIQPPADDACQNHAESATDKKFPHFITGPETANQILSSNNNGMVNVADGCCICYFTRNLLEQSLQPVFKQIDPTLLKFVLDSDDLIIRHPGDWEAMNTEDRETTILGIVLKYLIANRLEDDPVGEYLMRSVRLLDIEPSRVIRVIEECGFLSKNKDIMWWVVVGGYLWRRPQDLNHFQIPESWRRHRVLARWQRHHGTRVPRNLPLTRLDANEISEITISIGNLLGHGFLNLSEVKYRHYITKEPSETYLAGINIHEVTQYTVKLADQELITKCSYAIGSGVIVSLAFDTNAGNIYGPYVAPDGEIGACVSEGHSRPTTTFLYKLRNKIVSLNSKLISLIDLEWITFS